VGWNLEANAKRFQPPLKDITMCPHGVKFDEEARTQIMDIDDDDIWPCCCCASKAMSYLDVCDACRPDKERWNT
jgi:hypothetical protein